MRDYSNAFGNVELPQQQSSGNTTPRESNVDYEALNEAQIDALGGLGKHSFIGVCTNCYDLGTQKQDEQTIPIDSDDYSNHEWRLEKWEDSGIQKDLSAKIEKRWYKKKEQDCLVYTPPEVKQFAMAVDLPEVMFNYGEFFEGGSEKPFRVILGKEGFIPKGKAEIAGTRNLIAKPFNLKHVNVNRGRDGVAPHYALAKNGKVVKIADLAGVTDENGNFHAQDVGKLIGKAFMCEVEVKENKWNDRQTGEERCRVEINAEVVSKLGPRDVPFYENELKPKLSEDLFGFVVFNGENEEHTLKTLNSAVINTMKLSPEFESSGLKKQLEALGKLGGNVQGSTSQKEASIESKPEKVYTPETQIKEEPFDFDDSIPF